MGMDKLYKQQYSLNFRNAAFISVFKIINTFLEPFQANAFDKEQCNRLQIIALNTKSLRDRVQ